MPAAAAILEVESFCYRNLGHINRVEQHAQPGFHSIVFSTAAANGISMRVMNELEWTAATSDAQFARRRVQCQVEMWDNNETERWRWLCTTHKNIMNCRVRSGKEWRMFYDLTRSHMLRVRVIHFFSRLLSGNYGVRRGPTSLIPINNKIKIVFCLSFMIDMKNGWIAIAPFIIRLWLWILWKVIKF